MLYEYYKGYIVSGTNYADLAASKQNRTRVNKDRAYPCKDSADLLQFITETGVNVSDIENIEPVLLVD